MCVRAPCAFNRMQVSWTRRTTNRSVVSPSAGSTKVQEQLGSRARRLTSARTWRQGRPSELFNSRELLFARVWPRARLLPKRQQICAVRQANKQTSCWLEYRSSTFLLDCAIRRQHGAILMQMSLAAGRWAQIMAAPLAARTPLLVVTASAKNWIFAGSTSTPTTPTTADQRRLGLERLRVAPLACVQQVRVT